MEQFLFALWKVTNWQERALLFMLFPLGLFSCECLILFVIVEIIARILK